MATPNQQVCAQMMVQLIVLLTIHTRRSAPNVLRRRMLSCSPSVAAGAVDPACWQLAVGAGFLCFWAGRPVIALTFLMAT
jgi:hypothetical protein